MRTPTHLRHILHQDLRRPGGKPYLQTWTPEETGTAKPENDERSMNNQKILSKYENVRADEEEDQEEQKHEYSAQERERDD